jgi:hypothetical protein
LFLAAAFAAALLVQDAPVSTAPQAPPEPPPAVEIAPTPPPLVVPPPPLDPIEELLNTDEEATEADAEGPPAVPPPAPEPAPALPPGPQPYRPSPPQATPVQPAPHLPTTPQPYARPALAAPQLGLPPAPQPYVRPPAAAEPAPALPAGPRPYNSLPATPAPRVSPRPYEAPGGGYIAEQAYESGVRASAQAAQRQRGPLDGAWLIAGTDGARLYMLQLSDAGYGVVEGAWRDANGLPGLRSGFIASAQREGAGMTFRFFERNGRQPVSVSLRPAGDGRSWTGELDRADGRRTVTMRPQ